jgi:hypothetical protein
VLGRVGVGVEGDGELHLVAKVVAVESGRSWATSVEGSPSETIATLARQLGEDLLLLIELRSSELSPGSEAASDPLDAVQAALGDVKRPMIAIEVTERFVGRPGNDETAKTVLQWGLGLRPQGRGSTL